MSHDSQQTIEGEGEEELSDEAVNMSLNDRDVEDWHVYHYSLIHSLTHSPPQALQRALLLSRQHHESGSSARDNES